MDHLHEARGRLCLAGRSPCRWRPTWRQLVALEPGLGDIEAAVAFTGRPLRAAEWRFVEGMVADQVGGFGLNAMHPLLGEPSAYEAVLEHLRAVSVATRRYRPWRRRRW